ncbi:hypothetical protein PF004_g10769 [Phytophthora fragariae]|uniref:Uncharacterized protein n=1 Tax=Phytophthora fragariae TaxID=53985 RepID=A0A6G0NZW3_9STRA|nr:hypothetical protein PF004_g10769 [Phytophthora fragariae]
MTNGVLRRLTWLTCLVYSDGIVVYMKGGGSCRSITQIASTGPSHLAGWSP